MLALYGQEGRGVPQYKAIPDVVLGIDSSPNKDLMGLGHQMDRDIFDKDGINKHCGWFLIF